VTPLPVHIYRGLLPLNLQLTRASKTAIPLRDMSPISTLLQCKIINFIRSTRSDFLPHKTSLWRYPTLLDCLVPKPKNCRFQNNGAYPVEGHLHTLQRLLLASTCSLIGTRRGRHYQRPKIQRQELLRRGATTAKDRKAVFPLGKPPILTLEPTSPSEPGPNLSNQTQQPNRKPSKPLIHLR
jgi:hypothetical protein